MTGLVRDAFEGAAKNWPHRPAIWFNGKEILYAQLNARANQWARYLRTFDFQPTAPQPHAIFGEGLGPTVRIGIYLPQCPEISVSLLAIMKAGYAFFPLPADAEAPLQRLVTILKSAQPQALITTKEYTDSLAVKEAEGQGCRILLIENLHTQLGIYSEANLAPQANNAPKPEDLAYIYYTSGSTGVPKGVMVSHRNFLNVMESAIKCLAIDEKSRVAQLASIGFDASLMEMGVALLQGATLFLAPRGEKGQLEINGLSDFYRNNEISVGFFTPSLLALLIPEQFTSLRQVLYTGEKSTSEVIARWKAAGKICHDGYGPTECTIGATLNGIPMKGVEILILEQANESDKFFSESQEGENKSVGEIYLSGDCLGLGYWNESELTKSRFIEVEHSHPEHKEDRVFAYKTGDVGYLEQADGTEVLTVLGRIDRAVKVHGKFVQLEEIETVLLNYRIDNQKTDATLFSKTYVDAIFPEEGRPPVFIGFGFLKEENLHVSLDLSLIETFLKEYLPVTMIPSRWFFRPEKDVIFCLNQNQKIDQKNLWQLCLNDTDTYPLRLSRGYQDVLLPQTDAEEKLRVLWYEILKLQPSSIANISTQLPLKKNQRINHAALYQLLNDRIDIGALRGDDNFFALGGTSLQSALFLTRIQEELGLSISLPDFSDNPTWGFVVRQWRRMQGQRPYSSSLVRLSASTETFPQGVIPVFLIHSLLGDARRDYELLASTCGPELPVFGITSPGLEQPELMSNSFKEMAKSYLEIIDNVYKGEIYIIAGWSAGGLIAVALQELLQRHGKTVHTVLFDSRSPILFQKMPTVKLATFLSSLIKGKEKTADPRHSLRERLGLKENKLNQLLDRFTLMSPWISKPMLVVELLRALKDLNAKNKHKNPNEIENNRRLLVSIENILLGMLKQTLSPLQHNVLLIPAEETQQKTKDKRLGWPSGWPLEVKPGVKSEAGHFFMLEEEAIRGLHFHEIVKTFTKKSAGEPQAIKKVVNFIKELLIKDALVIEDFKALVQQVYAEPEAKYWKSVVREQLQIQCRAFLDQRLGRVLALVGDPGSGKTRFIHAFVSQCLTKFQEAQIQGKTLPPLPLLITLNSVLHNERIRPANLLEDYLKKIVGLKAAEINLLKTHQSLIVFCDGFDEIGFEGNLYQSNRWAQNWPHLKCIISTRPEKFGSFLSEEMLQRALIKAFSPIPIAPGQSLPDSLKITQLQPFSTDQVQAFIAQWQPLAAKIGSSWPIAQYQQGLENIPGLRELTSNPVILSLVLYVLPQIIERYACTQDPLQRKQLQRIDIYDNFVDVWFEKQSERLMQKLQLETPMLFIKLASLQHEFNVIEALKNYTSQLAYWTLLNAQVGKLAVEIPHDVTLKAYLLNDPTRVGPGLSNQLSEEETIMLCSTLRSGCLLNCKEGYFRFFHKSLVEYFAQVHIFRGVTGLLQLAVEEESIEQGAEVLNHLITDINLLRILAERVKQEAVNHSSEHIRHSFKSHLCNIIQESRINPGLGYAASNALTILNYAGERLNLLPLDGVHVPGADLSNAFLYRANLKSANLSGVRFMGAYLAEADLTDAQVDDCEWNTLPINLKFGDGIETLVYTPDGRGLIIGDRSGKISFVDTQSYKVDGAINHGDFSVHKDKEKNGVMAMAINGGKDIFCNRLASGNRAGEIYLWNLPERTYQQKLSDRLLRGSIWGLAFHPDGVILASGSSDGAVRLWDTLQGTLLQCLRGHAGAVGGVSWSPQGQYLASSSRDGTVRVWDIVNNVSQVLKGHTACVSYVAWSHEGSQVASVSDDKTVRVWQAPNGAVQILTGHTSSVHYISWSPQDKQLVSGGDDGTVRLWDMGNGTSKIIGTHAGRVNCVIWSPQGQHVATGSYDQKVQLWNISRTVIRVSQKHNGDVFCVNWSPNGRQLVSGGWDDKSKSWDRESEKKVRLWDLEKDTFRVLDSRACQQCMPSYENWRFHGEGRPWGASARKWGRYHTDTIDSLTWSPNGKQVASGSWDYTVRIWDLSKNISHVLVGHTRCVHKVAWSPQGTHLASAGCDGTIRIWKLSRDENSIKKTSARRDECLVTKGAVQVFKGHECRVNCVAWSPDGKQVVSGGVEGNIQVWDLLTGLSKKIGQHKSRIHCAAWSSCGKRIIYGGDKGILRLWDLVHDAGYVLEGQHSNMITSVFWFQEDTRIASGSHDMTVRLWNTLSKECYCIITVGFTVEDFYFRQPERLLMVVGPHEDGIQYLAYRLASDKPWLCDWHDWNAPPFTTHSFDKTIFSHVKGLSPSHHRLLQNQGAVGKPLVYLPSSLSTKEAQEELQELAKLVAFQKALRQIRDALQCNCSILSSALHVSYHQWQVYFLRITSPKYPSSVSSFFSNNRHVYGLLEGLDQLGRHVFIRFDLVREQTAPRFARVRVKILCTQEMSEEIESRAAFMELFHGLAKSPPTKLIYFPAGQLALKELDTLLTHIIQEQGRQAPSTGEECRIRYQFLGGNEASNEAHNCLTWLRYMLNDFENLKMPRSAMDRLYADPNSVLPAPSLFFNLPKGIQEVDLASWLPQLTLKNKIRHEVVGERSLSPRISTFVKPLSTRYSNNEFSRENSEEAVVVLKQNPDSSQAAIRQQAASGNLPYLGKEKEPVIFAAPKDNFASTPFWRAGKPVALVRKPLTELVTDREVANFCQENRIEGFKCIVRDGNCFFHAVLAALPEHHQLNQADEGHLELRKQAIQYIRNNPERFSPDCVENELLEQYLTRMAKPSVWAEGVIIDATALLLNTTINVVELDKRGNDLITSENFVASHLESAEGYILVLRVNQSHYHLGMPLQSAAQLLSSAPQT